MKTHFEKPASSLRAHCPETKSWALVHATWLALLLSPLFLTTVRAGPNVVAWGYDTYVRWRNNTTGRTGPTQGTNTWWASNIPLLANRTNTVLVTATTTSWAAGYGGNTTFGDTLVVFCSPIRATLALQGSAAILNWTGAAPPHAVQHATDLTKGDWADLLINSAPPVSLPTEGGAEFYRVVGK